VEKGINTMKKLICIKAVVLFAIALSGCTSFDRFAAEKRLSSANIGIIQRTGTALAKPLKLGILLDLETVDSDGEYHRKWRWDDTDKRMVCSYADSLVKEGAVSGYFFIAEQDAPLQDLNAVLANARENGAEALLSIRGVISVEKYMNPFGILDPTIIGALVLPGSTLDVTLLARLDLRDLKSHKTLFSLKSEDRRQNFNTTFFIRTNAANTENAVSEVKTDTLRNLLIDFKKEFARIGFQPYPSNPENEKLPTLPDGK